MLKNETKEILYTKLIDFLKDESKMQNEVDIITNEIKKVNSNLSSNIDDVGFCRILEKIDYLSIIKNDYNLTPYEISSDDLKYEGQRHRILNDLGLSNQTGNPYWYYNFNERLKAIENAYTRFKKNCFRQN